MNKKKPKFWGIRHKAISSMESWLDDFTEEYGIRLNAIPRDFQDCLSLRKALKSAKIPGTVWIELFLDDEKEKICKIMNNLNKY
jgi:hypothetical protein